MPSLGDRLSRLGDLVAEPSQHIDPRRLRVFWFLSIVLVIGGNALYLLIANYWSWWVGGLLTWPFLFLAIDKLDGAGGASGGADGPWSPP